MTAYVFFLNDIIKSRRFRTKRQEFWNDQASQRANFYDDDREVTEKSFWRKNPCMTELPFNRKPR